jgi:hypothetical protein
MMDNSLADEGTGSIVILKVFSSSTCSIILEGFTGPDVLFHAIERHQPDAVKFLLKYCQDDLVDHIIIWETRSCFVQCHTRVVLSREEPYCMCLHLP